MSKPQELKRLAWFKTWPMERKLSEFTVPFVHRAIADHGEDGTYLAWSGGKDSTVLLHIVRSLGYDVPVMYNNTLIEFPECRRFVKRIAQDWNLNLIEARPRDKRFLDCVQEYGWPLFGKPIRAGSGQKIKAGGMTVAELADKGIRLSDRCCYWLKEKPCIQAVREHGFTCGMTGIMASESHNRMMLWMQKGPYYPTVKRKPAPVMCHPLMIWTDADVWEYIGSRNVPYSPLYDMGHVRNGCWPCGMAVRYGRYAILRQSHPKLWETLMFRWGLASVLATIKLGVDPGEERIRGFLQQRPCFFG